MPVSDYPAPCPYPHCKIFRVSQLLAMENVINTFHATIKEYFQFLLHFLGFSPMSNTSFDTLPWCWDGIFLLLGADHCFRFDTCNISRISSNCIANWRNQYQIKYLLFTSHLTYACINFRDFANILDTRLIVLLRSLTKYCLFTNCPISRRQIITWKLSQNTRLPLRGPIILRAEV